MPLNTRFNVVKVKGVTYKDTTEKAALEAASKILQDNQSLFDIDLICSLFEGRDIEIYDSEEKQTIHLKNASVLHVAALFNNINLYNYTSELASPKFNINQNNTCTLIIDDKIISDQVTAQAIAYLFSPRNSKGIITSDVIGTKDKKELIDKEEKNLKEIFTKRFVITLVGGLFLGLLAAGLIIAFPPAGILASIGLAATNITGLAALAATIITFTSIAIGISSSFSLNKKRFELKNESYKLEKIVAKQHSPAIVNTATLISSDQNLAKMHTSPIRTAPHEQNTEAAKAAMAAKAARRVLIMKKLLVPK